MPGPKVFVSYSRRDKKALAQLQRFLKPLERNGLISAWADTDLEAGDDWEPKFQEALATATVAVLLISQDFLASDFIAWREIPILLEREAEGKLTIIPVFLSPSSVEDTLFPDPRSGGKGTLVLSKFEGYGQPERPFSDLEWPERERILADLARRLGSLAGGQTWEATAPKPATSGSATSTLTSARPARCYELTLHLEERDGTLHRTYHLPGLEPIGSTATPRVEIGERLVAIHQSLDTANNLALKPHLAGAPTGWGEALFGLLFGPPDDWERILRLVFGQPTGPRPNPTRFPVRLRIHTDDFRYSGLPWRLTAWNGQPLLDSDWTFLTTHILEPRDEPLTTAPSNVLLVMPQTRGQGGGPHEPEHERAVRDTLAKAWPTGRDPGYVQVAATREQLEQGLRDHHPHLVYIYARGVATEGRPSLLLEGANGPVPFALADLRRQIRATQQRPAVLYLNTEGLNDGSGAGPIPTPEQILGDTVPLLLWRRRPEWSADSTTTALLWLHSWLSQGRDPIAAFHQIQQSAIEPGCEVCTVLLHSNARDWHTSPFQSYSQPRYPSLRLDRDHQKSLVRKHLEELVRSSSRRVMALLPFAARGHSISSLAAQLLHYLEISLANLAEIRPIRITFPAGRSNLCEDFEGEIRLQLGAESKETLGSVLRRHAPQAVAPGRRPVLFIDWGSFCSEGALRPSLHEDQIEAWLRFSSEYIATNCPPELRVVMYAASEIPVSEHDAFARKLQEQRRKSWCRNPLFRLSEIPPLGKVAESDLLDFLEDPANSSCDGGIQQEVSELIIAKTGGSFEETVALLQEAEDGSWYDLLSRLRGEEIVAATQAGIR